jgi:hypothetical protein
LQRLLNPSKAFCEHLVVHTHPDAEMIGHLKKLAGDDGRLALGSEALQEFGNVAVQ